MKSYYFRQGELTPSAPVAAGESGPAQVQGIRLHRRSLVWTGALQSALDPSSQSPLSLQPISFRRPLSPARWILRFPLSAQISAAGLDLPDRAGRAANQNRGQENHWRQHDSTRPISVEESAKIQRLHLK